MPMANNPLTAFFSQKIRISAKKISNFRFDSLR
jgi:hypothetical protein